MNSPTKVNYIPGVDLRTNEGFPVVPENKETQFRSPNPNRPVEV